jgi:hypothetical protein
MPEKPRLNVQSDLDGVWNLPEVGRDAFERVYHGHIAGLLGIAVKTWDEVLEHAKHDVRSHPNEHGWMFEGMNVTPYWVDQYQENKAYAAQATRIVTKDNIKTRRAVPTEEELPDFLNSAFNFAHSSIIAPPKPGAREAIKKIMKVADFGIVTNSETVNAEKGLLQIFEGEEEIVQAIGLVGDSKKQKVDNTFVIVTINGRELIVPKEIEMKGTKRRPLLRRRLFMEALVKNGTDVYIEDTAEYLYSPLAIGIQGILLDSKRVRSFERNYVTNHEFNGHNNGYIAKDLDGIVKRVNRIASDR